MPNSIDILFERLLAYDEVTLLELLDISAEDILNRFRDKVVSRRKQLYGELEILDINDEEAEDADDWDGFQIDDYDDYNTRAWREGGIEEDEY